jgi:hypothetical protein
MNGSLNAFAKLLIILFAVIAKRTERPKSPKPTLH